MDEKELDDFLVPYYKLASKAKKENRMIMNHVCLRVDDLDKAEKLLSQSFGIDGFIRPGGKLFKGEKDLSVAWINDEMYFELSQPEKNQELGYDTGCGHLIGHLSEIGFFVPHMDRELNKLKNLGWGVIDEIKDIGARMVKIDLVKPSGLPVELIEVFDSEGNND